jgi:hypothetical protein
MGELKSTNEVIPRLYTLFSVLTRMEYLNQKSRRYVMKVLSSRLIKAAVVATFLVSGVADAACSCAQIAGEYATSARNSVLRKLSTCDQYQGNPTAYNACAAPIYAEADALYNYVYSNAYSGCSRACPL